MNTESLVIDKRTFQARRERLIQHLPDNAVVIIRTGELAIRNNDCNYKFRPNSTFFYLTGFPEPRAYVLINSNGDTLLVALPKDPEKEVWEGFRYGCDCAINKFGVNNAITINELDDGVLAFLDSARHVVFLFSDDHLHQQVIDWCNQLDERVHAGAIAPTSLIDLAPYVSEMRLRKDTEEISLLKKSGQISVEAHKQVMRIVRPSMKEYELEAELNYVFMKSDACQPAYNSIVASGNNACVLHYTKNDGIIGQDDLVLVDAGAEYGYYASDITRTFPASGKFTEPQAILYQVVLDAYHASMRELNVGTSYEAYHNAAVRVLTQGLVKHGLLQGDLDSLIESKAYRDFYMHNTGHWLGLDVHDCGDYKVNSEFRLLEEGMVLTIEPGLYVSSDNALVDEKWRGIGIRIEDDILVHQEGPYVLTHGLPTEISEIEAFMAENRQ